MDSVNSIFRLLLISAVVMPASLPEIADAQTEFTEIRTVGGEVCNTRNPAVRGIRRKNAALYNVHSENFYKISCPIVTRTFRHVELEAPASSLGIEPIFLNFHETTQTVQCKLLHANEDGTVERIESARQIIGPDETDNLRLGVSSVNAFEPLTLECRLPPQTALLSLTFYQMGSTVPASS